MDDAVIEQFRVQLQELKAELQANEETSRDSTMPVELDQTRVGRLSRMDAMQGQQMAREVARRRQRQLVRIEAALRRMDAGEFGACYVCGVEIDLRRLAADPASTRCIKCVD